jgi:PAS domain S-box-containing protein
MHLASTLLPTIVFWNQAQYMFTQATMFAFLVFALCYTGHENWLKPAKLVLIAIVPLLTSIVAWTNGLHGLLWKDIVLDVDAPVPGFLFRHGPWYWVNVVYTYLILLSSAALLVLNLFRSPGLYRRQIAAILVAVFAPWVANILYLTGLNLIPGLNLTPLSLTLSNLAFTWSLFRFRFMDIVPVARTVVVETLPDPVIVLDGQNRVVDLNPTASRLVDQAEAEAIGRPIKDLFADWSELVELARYPHPVHKEVTVVRGDERLHFDLRVSPLQNRRDQLPGRLIILHDITEQARAAEQREQLIAELDAFAHTVAHDLKNPLASIVGYSKLLEMRYERMDAFEIQDLLGTITQSGLKMGSIIDELLLLSTVRDVQEIEIVPLDMGAIVAGAQLRLTSLIEKYDAEIILPPAWPMALGQRGWVEEVWANYISNAIKYGGHPPRVELGAGLPSSLPTAPSNGGKVAAASSPQGTEGEIVRFWVRDNGPGISYEEQRRLFHLFTRLDKVKAEGHGLGLSIVRRIVEKLGGKVEVESEQGQGSVFSFTLPSAEFFKME